MIPFSTHSWPFRSFAIAALTILASGAGAEALVGHVVGVTDGDTITVLDVNNNRYKIRLSGIDAPEKEQPYGTRAKQHLSELVFQKSVTVQWDKRDRYGRIVGKVMVQSPDCPSCPRDLDTGQAQLSVGLAWWYQKYAKEQSPDDRRRYEYEENAARARRVGLWSDPAPVPPWQFRSSDKPKARAHPGRQGKYAVVTVANLKVRAGQSSGSTIRSRLNKGERVEVLDARGKWWLIDPVGPATPGYVSSRYLDTPDVRVNSTDQIASSTLRTKSEIAKEIISESIARFPGKCPCPYNTDRAGRRCGARSAYVKPGGLTPMCFESDVPDQLLRAGR